MRKLLTLAMALACAAALLIVGIFALSELGGEVVTVRSTRADGSVKSTRLWIVDDAGETWLRAGIPTEPWLEHIGDNPTIQLVRAGDTKPFVALAVRTAEARDRVHALMAAKYGTADKIISLIRDSKGSVAVRLQGPATGSALSDPPDR
ncbi:MAG: hypothetical protein ACE5EO_02300 [Candidatus Krumholzibacteriia bacterium]